jgi:hypothetical protein
MGACAVRRILNRKEVNPREKVDQDPAKLGSRPRQTFGASYSAKGKSGTP